MGQRNEGEGNRTAAKKYNKGATEHAESGRSKAAAEDAERAMDTPEGTAMREAEIKGKSAARGEDPKLYKKNEGGPKSDADLD
ncbi:MAG: hypothetical protein ACREIP_18685 [Alphaproteobacteria bacterium]